MSFRSILLIGNQIAKPPEKNSLLNIALWLSVKFSFVDIVQVQLY